MKILFNFAKLYHKIMKMRKKDSSKPSGTLLIKIFTGYTILTLLLVGIIAALWHEKRVFAEAEEEENAMLAQRELTSRTFKALVSLFLDNESAYLREMPGQKEYNEKENRVFFMLDELRKVYTDSLQQARIDTVEFLLNQKHDLIGMLRNMPSALMQMDSILTEQLPALERKMISSAITAHAEPARLEKKNFLSRLFSREKKRQEAAPSVQQNIRQTENVRNIRRFGDEMYEMLERQNRLSESLADSLDHKNRILNRNISRLINELEKDALERTAERHQRVSELREEAFDTICIISSAALLCALFLSIFITKDIHRKYRNRKELEDSNRHNRKMLEIRKKIIITLSHDIRGPLNAIRGSAELAMDTKDKKRRNSYLDNILSSTGHIMRLVNSLLDLSRLNEAKETLNEIPFRLDTFLSDIEKEYGRIANDKGIMLSGDFIGTDIAVTGDADRIEQIISNLLSNAVKFTESGSIGFFAIYRNDMLTVTVRDTGIGMSEETMERIFTPFERAAVEICPEGFGLGLSITKGLVTLLKGEISVESRIGEGSTFKVSIPLRETSETIEEKCKPLPDPAKRLPHRIIVVEDDPVQMEITRDILERNGVSCHACQNVKEVVCLLRKEDYDLILTDIQMPGTNGFSLLNLLRNSNIGSSRSIPIAAMTARGDEEKENFIKAGFTGCIHKPFSSPELLLFLSSIMEKMNKPESQSIDFRPLISDSGNKRKILTMLVKESETNKEELVEAIRNKDRMRIKEIIHRMLPMWEMLGIAEELQEYRNLVHDDSSEDQVLKEWTLKITASLDRLVSAAENEINSLIRQENEKENTDS